MCLKDRIALTPHIDLTSLMKYPELALKRITTGFLPSLATKSDEPESACTHSGDKLTDTQDSSRMVRLRLLSIVVWNV